MRCVFRQFNDVDVASREGTNNWPDMVVDGRIILKWALRTWNVGVAWFIRLGVGFSGVFL
jgi:hypothetical protein